MLNPAKLLLFALIVIYTGTSCQYYIMLNCISSNSANANPLILQMQMH